ncbi:GntT/GntP/DsdX family permease [Acetobacter oeni]|uniref:GntP family transporter n=1 Tax=Acetobacter oeni TaxID=304077 RepID=A0A511XKS9_9PROT|nr:gluconate:H+ symporter [Acetobacter oeni]MBB3883797.1 GntP family gluconate:H+ symporter [Acetobacter oeni]NHO19860.1 transporter [Acetobacter oeni]GBR10435.1 H+/gluconate symporter [Acetobacter oeni LMG 21952]GEN63551.1 GntP family transporter [Acetobacter oeni]
MTPVLLLASAIAGIILMIVLILRFRLQPVLALLLVSMFVAILSGMPLDRIAPAIEAGMGKTLGHIAIIITLGAMIGKIVEISGGAEVLARTLIGRFGSRRIPLALTLAGFLIGIPVFFEVGVIMVMPIIYGVSRLTHRQIMVFALPMCVTMLTVHSFLPPHPGPAAAAAQIGADLGRILAFGLPITLILGFTGYVIASRMTRREFSCSEDIRRTVEEMSEAEGGVLAGEGTVHAPPPPFGIIVALILFPVVLIMSGTFVLSLTEAGTVLHNAAALCGAPMTALLIDTLLAGWLLGLSRGWSHVQVSEVVGSAVPGVAMVILIAGAGGVFGNILVQSGIGHVVSGLLHASGLPVLALAFVLSALLRAIQGSTTVALVTTAGILSPLLQTLTITASQKALLCLPMGGGGLSISHINDAGFWIFTKLTGIDTGESLRTWTVLTSILGFLGFCMTAILWPLCA